jgi:hypothetical protein
MISQMDGQAGIQAGIQTTVIQTVRLADRQPSKMARLDAPALVSTRSVYPEMRRLFISEMAQLPSCQPAS